MIKDITLGQYFPGNTIVHKLDARLKIIITFAFVLTIFAVRGIFAYSIMLAWLGLCIYLSKISLRIILRGLKPVLFVVAFTGIINIFYTPGNVVLFKWQFIQITLEGIFAAGFMLLRITMLITGSFLLTYTTSPIMLTDAIEKLFDPLKRFRFPAHELAMMMTIALRFIPTLIEETDKIMSAQRARGADFESGGLMRRAKALVPLLVPLFISAFRRADELAVAMECRCYSGGEGRTRMRELRMHSIDYYALYVFCPLMILSMVLSWLA